MKLQPTLYRVKAPQQSLKCRKQETADLYITSIITDGRNNMRRCPNFSTLDGTVEIFWHWGRSIVLNWNYNFLLYLPRCVRTIMLRNFHLLHLHTAFVM
jgi:hypothetical protein